ncbi:N-6 DNA methylase [Yersinia hibernica]|uniref:site-specific DNA-methyltransferase (adenine-specific) n=1 Tax=Yersinia enterocolitica LC20 TaxID=1443113 RepID=A0A7U4K304_YEREN|nr:N-6 DNA methylase [Yersinia hibernica]AHM76350.1 hypothetical protein LC20_05099 [Yersinia hibernica]HDL7032568.1 N-6 DNA methylase [Yersinia enterocolitica]
MKKGSEHIQISVSVPKDLLVEIDKENVYKNRSQAIRKILQESIVERSKKNGAVYTPRYLATYLADKIFHYEKVFNGSNDKVSYNILDPACGDGELLSAIYRTMADGYNLNLIGVDIDKKAIKKAESNIPDIFKGIIDNALCPMGLTRQVGWGIINKNLKIKDGYDFIIANPPWGADITNYKKLIEEGCYELYSGQSDTSDLFLELSLDILKKDGLLAFIVPDSIFYQDRAKLRKVLLDKTNILFIGRFGEKIFKDINRGCAIIICHKSTPNNKHEVECFRLPVDAKNNILKGFDSLSAAESRYKHKVLQERFYSTSDYLFNLDIDISLEKTYSRIARHKNRFGELVHNYRGIELSKKGKVVRCFNCNKWSPLPKNNILFCKFCHSSSEVSSLNTDVIIHKFPEKNCKPLIVGENINRYKISYEFCIAEGKNGINYKKDEIYIGDKILVRKTGIGISASIDYTSSLTNQVVYIFKLKKTAASHISIELLLAILNSRAIFFFVAMSNGEIEWKSHPYVTQKQVLDIPIPDLTLLDRNLIVKINSMNETIRKTLSSGFEITKDIDIEIERVVAEIYGLTVDDYNSIYSAIDKSQELISVKALKKISVNDIFNY